MLTFNYTNICMQKILSYYFLKKFHNHFGIRNPREKEREREYYFLEIFLVQNSITKPYSNIPTKKRV